MFKKIVVLSLLLQSLGMSAQIVSSVILDETGNKAIIDYLPKTSRPARAVISVNGGEWTDLKSVKELPTEGAGGCLEWDIYKDYPNGVRNAVIRVFALTDEDIQYIDKSGIPAGSRGRVYGNKAYFLNTSSSSQYAGDLRKGTAATPTDMVKKSADVYIYDFITGAWDKRYKVASWEGRVPRKTHNGIFPAPKIPDYRIEITPSGKVYVGKTQISDDNEAVVSSSQVFTFIPRFSSYAKNYVESRINQWQQIGEFEKTDDYKARIRNERQNMVAQYLEEAKAEYLDNLKPKDFPMSLGKYDADSETFAISTPDFGVLTLPVPIGEAEKFKKGWPKVVAYPDYVIQNDVITLRAVAFKPDKGKSKKIYYYTKDSEGTASEPEIKFEFNPTSVDK